MQVWMPSAAGVANTITETNSKVNLDMKNCRGQGYDGAGVCFENQIF